MHIFPSWGSANSLSLTSHFSDHILLPELPFSFLVFSSFHCWLLIVHLSSFNKYATEKHMHTLDLVWGREEIGEEIVCAWAALWCPRWPHFHSLPLRGTTCHLFGWTLLDLNASRDDCLNLWYRTYYNDAPSTEWTWASICHSDRNRWEPNKDKQKMFCVASITRDHFHC